ncbi:MAG: response regulator [Bacteroidia bacterium]|nr:response regulator [Bacteroidia bacterium]MDW8333704.1 response regulator [Bacteroidia bacterium]
MPTKKPVILCVDDERSVHEALIPQLRSRFGSDFLYETCDNTDDAWELVEELLNDGYEIRVVISDWLMPMEKGDKFLIGIRQRLPNAKLILLSGHVDEASVERARTHAQIHAYIRKPWEKAQLLAVLEE